MHAPQPKTIFINLLLIMICKVVWTMYRLGTNFYIPLWKVVDTGVRSTNSQAEASSLEFQSIYYTIATLAMICWGGKRVYVHLWVWKTSGLGLDKFLSAKGFGHGTLKRWNGMVEMDWTGMEWNWRLGKGRQLSKWSWQRIARKLTKWASRTT